MTSASDVSLLRVPAVVLIHGQYYQCSSGCDEEGAVVIPAANRLLTIAVQHRLQSQQCSSRHTQLMVAGTSSTWSSLVVVLLALVVLLLH